MRVRVLTGLTAGALALSLLAIPTATADLQPRSLTDWKTFGYGWAHAGTITAGVLDNSEWAFAVVNLEGATLQNPERVRFVAKLADNTGAPTLFLEWELACRGTWNSPTAIRTTRGSQRADSSSFRMTFPTWVDRYTQCRLVVAAQGSGGPSSRVILRLQAKYAV